MSKPTPPKPNPTATRGGRPSLEQPGAEPTPKLQAYLVLKDDMEVGVLGTGPGPFLSASRKRASEVVFEHVQFVSSHFLLERQVRDAMQGPASLAEVRQRLLQAGFELREIPFGRGLRVPGQEAEALPSELGRELDEDVHDLMTGDTAGEDAAP